ncbi:hypothetical protein HMPREF0044_1259 [Gleimia coleocanis DSM 15436]|uniref:RNA polymerase-binding protein RbpA n=1 Tax=Gleimia coleocanis DSM 15436 TaxID=525245 RepID=C0W1G9_9ACTO|nr:RNA polymerase-binding protein RbpA [Gleimia coleocanis]EEH63335.1 hypothetical protein HMPREF0044_1259 [Gleimia coleocanis DSM 15436]
MENSAAVEYYCARDHLTRVIFSAEAILDVPQTWECTTCFQPATRNRETSDTLKSVENPGRSFTKSHQTAFQQRRTKRESEEILATALKKLRSEQP